jgi:23S rRNA (cytosine1962-C5)-methyltransferase
VSRFSSFPQPPKPHGKWIGGELLAAFAAASTNAHRLYSSEQAWVERFGEDLLISYKYEAALESVMAELIPFAQTHGLVWRRIFAKHLPLQNEERIAPVLLEGDAALPLETVVEENGMKFGLDFAAGYSAGLFIDQRANRAFLRRSGAKRVLNTFAYTCSFSVAAALNGAQTTSIDLSKKSLDRGRANFLLNGLDPEAGHQFIADDVLERLPRMERKSERFDAIILDPPTFSRGAKGRRFQVENDLEGLLMTAFELAAPKTKVLLSTNCTKLNRRALETIARFCLKASRRSGTFHYEPALPDLPMEFSAQTLWIC